MSEYTEFDNELDATMDFLYGFTDILVRITGLRDIDLDRKPIDIFDEDVLNTCRKIYDEDMQFLYQMGELDPY